jgi:thioredoxin-dependent peroxiredoxin
MARFPLFSLPGSDDQIWTSKELKGTPYLIYFYPKDQTPGCTTEACDFRDHMEEFNDLEIPVFGVSPDSIASHKKFIQKQDLNFVLLSDEDHALAEKAGAWGEKLLYGKTSMGVIRSTFLVDADGMISKSWLKVKVADHVTDVLAAIEELRELEQSKESDE